MQANFRIAPANALKSRRDLSGRPFGQKMRSHFLGLTHFIRWFFVYTSISDIHGRGTVSRAPMRYMRPMIVCFVGCVITFYQRVISAAFPPACRFYPSCASYFLTAVKTRGAVLGSIKGLYRILRCHPCSSGGYDPV